MFERVTIVLTGDEMARLRKLAQCELRRPRDQATYILRSVLLGEQSSIMPMNVENAANPTKSLNGAFVEIHQ